MKPFRATRPTHRPQPLVSADVVQAAIKLHRDGQLDEAREAYRRILAVAPGLPDVLHFQGLLKYQTQGGDAGIADVRQALKRVPDYADAHANLAIMLLDVADYTGAEQHLDRALKLDPKTISPRVSLARVYRKQGRAQDAETLLREITTDDRLRLDSELGPVVFTALGNALLAQGRIDEALQEYRAGLSIKSDHSLLRSLVGRALCLLGRFDEAAANFRHMLELNPDDATARHMLAACGGASVPVRADDVYVKETFDAFSNSFDSKLASLGYRAPQLIASLLTQCIGDRRADLDLADAGCGTGLLGEIVRPWCRQLAGVDLSSGMLARARARNLYDSLDEGELTAWLSARSACFDVVAIADTLCYFGALEEALLASRQSLRDGGWLLFTVEHRESPSPYMLQTHGRYSHRRDYVEQALAAAGFGKTLIQQDVLRTERHEPVHGLVVAAQK